MTAVEVDWEAILRRMDARIRKFDWPRPLPSRCAGCGGAKCKQRPGHRWRCIYCGWEVYLPKASAEDQ